jgi:transposase
LSSPGFGEAGDVTSSVLAVDEAWAAIEPHLPRGRSGNIADISMAIPLLSAAMPARRLLTDKAYEADNPRNWLKQRRIKAVIPSTASRRTPHPLDKRVYRRRNLIGYLFCRLKNWRRSSWRRGRSPARLRAVTTSCSASFIHSAPCIAAENTSFRLENRKKDLQYPKKTLKGSPKVTLDRNAALSDNFHE